MRLMHTMIRVMDMNESIRFYSECLGMRVLRRLGEDDGKDVVFIGYGDEESTSVLELSYAPDKKQYVRGEYFGHLAIGVPNVDDMFQRLCEAGAKPLKPPRWKDGELLASVEDPNGYKIELISDSPTTSGGNP